MFKRSPSRNNKSKVIKLKHVLQICLLLGVCFWLIYQIKHSHDKKKEFDEKDAQISVKTHSDEFNFGRKDLHPRIEQVTKKEKHEEEEEEETGGEEEENKHEPEEREEEENKHDIEEQEEEENKSEETEDEERGGGDDELDEKDQEKSDEEADHDEEFIDEEKEREEGDEKESERDVGEGKENQVENENSSEDQDHDGGNGNSREAREEHYKGDDASSAVTHDTQTINTETDRVSLENSNEISEMSLLEQENKSSNAEEFNGNRNNSGLKLGEGEMAENGTSLNLNDGEEKGNDSSPNSVNNLLTNSTTTQSNDHPEAHNSTILVSEEASTKLAEVTTEASNNTTEISAGISGSSQQNGTETISDSAHTQNVMVDSKSTVDSLNVRALEMKQTNDLTTVSENNQNDFNSTLSVKVENADAAAGQSSNSSSNLASVVSEKILKSDVTAEAEDDSGSSASKGNTDATKDEKLDGNNESDGTDENSDVSSTLDTVQQDPIDESDSHFADDEKEVRIDLDTLPRTEGDNNEDIAAE